MRYAPGGVLSVCRRQQLLTEAELIVQPLRDLLAEKVRQVDGGGAKEGAAERTRPSAGTHGTGLDGHPHPESHTRLGGGRLRTVVADPMAPVQSLHPDLVSWDCPGRGALRQWLATLPAQRRRLRPSARLLRLLSLAAALRGIPEKISFGSGRSAGLRELGRHDRRLGAG